MYNDHEIEIQRLRRQLNEARKEIRRLEKLDTGEFVFEVVYEEKVRAYAVPKVLGNMVTLPLAKRIDKFDDGVVYSYYLELTEEQYGEFIGKDEEEGDE